MSTYRSSSPTSNLVTRSKIQTRWHSKLCTTTTIIKGRTPGLVASVTTTAVEQVVQVSPLNFIFSIFISLILGRNGYSSSCAWEWFYIRNTESSKSISRSSMVYFYRVFGCGTKKITANNDEYVKMFYSGLGPCEKWKIRLYLSYDKTIPSFYD